MPTDRSSLCYGSLIVSFNRKVTKKSLITVETYYTATVTVKFLLRIVTQHDHLAHLFLVLP